MKIFGFDKDIIYSEEHPAVLVIENSKLFAHITFKLYQLMSENIEDTELVILDNEDNLINFEDNIYLYTDVLGYDFNDRKLLTKIYKKIIDEIMYDSQTITSINSYFQKINQLIVPYQLDLDLNLTNINEIDLEDYLKLIKLHFDYTYYDSIIDKMMGIIDVEAELRLHKTIFFINGLSYFDQNEFKTFIRYIQSKKVNVIFLEKYIMEFKYDNMFIIDNDFIEV